MVSEVLRLVSVHRAGQWLEDLKSPASDGVADIMSMIIGFNLC
jgi:hypothetical protein